MINEKLQSKEAIEERTIIKKRTTEAIKMYYDIQKLRIGCGNRIVASFNIQLGQAPSTPQKEMDDESQKMINKLKAEYKRITDGYVENNISIKKQIAKMNESKDEKEQLVFIKSALDYDLMDEYMSLWEVEKKTEKTITSLIKAHPLWGYFFEPIKGCGPIMAAACVSYFDIFSARWPSSFMAYAGLNPVPYYNEDEEDPQNIQVYHRANSKSYTVMKKYIDRDGNVKEKKSITYNPQLKSILLGVLASCILRANIRTDKKTGIVTVTGEYANAYMDYKNRKRNQFPNYSASHINKMALNYMMRQFVKKLWVAWREVEGLTVPESYEEKFLGMKPHKFPTIDYYQKNIEE